MCLQFRHYNKTNHEGAKYISVIHICHVLILDCHAFRSCPVLYCSRLNLFGLYEIHKIRLQQLVINNNNNMIIKSTFMY